MGSLQAMGGSLDVNNLQSNSGGITASAGSTLTLHGTWQNTGTISDTNATVNLDSTFTLAQLGTFNRSGGTVNLRGTLNNTGTTLALTDTTGSWNLAGGTIRNGTVTTAGQAQLIATASSTLDGVTLGGDLEVNSLQTVTAVNGLTFSNGRVGLQSTFSNVTALRLSGAGPQTLAGTGQVVFAGGSFGSNNQVSAPGQPLTLAAGITVTTTSGGGTVGDPGQPLTIQGTVTATSSGQGISVTGTSINNMGSLQAMGGSLDVNNLQSNSGGITASAGSTLTLHGTWQNTGTISATNATVNLDSTFTLAQLGTFNRSGGTVNLRGTLNNTGTTLALTDTTGSWNLAGGTIRNGTVTTAGQAQLIATASSTLDGVTLGGDLEVNSLQTVTAVNGLTFSNGRVGLQSTFSNVTALRLSGAGPQTLAGTGQVVFAGGSFGSNNQVSAPGQPLTLAAGITVTTTSGGGTVGDPGQPLTIQGTVTATSSGQGISVTGTSINNMGSLQAMGGSLDVNNLQSNSGGITASAGSTLTLHGTWQNTGTISDTNATVNLDSTFTLAQLGTFNRSGGTVNLRGTLNNTGTTLALTDTTGSWNLAGGTIRNGTVTTAGQAQLIATASSTLDGVTLGGDLEVNSLQTVTAVNGLTFSNGRVGLQSTFSNVTALRLSGAGPQTLAGTGQVVFAGGSFGSNNQVSAPGQPLTLAAGITVTTTSGGGTVGDPGQPLTIQGTVTATSSGQGISVTGTSINNMGSLQAMGGSLDVNNLQSNSGGITASAGSTLTLHGTWQNTGTISATNATVNLDSTFTLAQLGTFNRSGGTVNLRGTLNNTGTTLALTDTTGSWNLAGGTIRNGTVTTAGQAQLIATASSTLDGVTLGGDLEVNSLQTVTAVNGLTFSNGRVGLQSTFSNVTALRLSGAGPQTLAGTGQVVFAGGSFGSNNQVSAPGQPLTLAAGITVTTTSGGGTVGDPGQPLTIQGTVTATSSGQGISVTGLPSITWGPCKPWVAPWTSTTCRATAAALPRVPAAR